jgi:hypothetical protein
MHPSDVDLIQVVDLISHILDTVCLLNIDLAQHIPEPRVVPARKLREWTGTPIKLEIVLTYRTIRRVDEEQLYGLGINRE